MITVLFVPGTFEQPSATGRPLGMLKKVADQLPAAEFDCRQVNYPMSYGNPMSYADSVDVGAGRVVSAIRQAPNPVVLVGFSQGAVVVARVAAELRARKYPDLDVRMVVTIANPERAEREGAHNVAGSGLAGGRSLARCPFPVVQLALPDDAITAASRDSLLRDVADLSAYMSGDVVRWASQALAKVTSGRLLQNGLGWRQNAVWMLGRTPTRVVTAAREIGGYLARPSVHTLYGQRIVPGTSVDYLTFAAQRITAMVSDPHSVNRTE